LGAFAAFTARRIQAVSVGKYISAIRSLHIDRGLADPTDGALTLQRILRGIRRKGKHLPAAPRLPITAAILISIRTFLNLRHRMDVVFWAAATTAFLGFLRCGEFTVSPNSEQDLILRSQAARLEPQAVFITLPGSKIDVFRLGVTVCIGRTGGLICAHSALRLLRLRHPSPSTAPLFPDPSGAPITRRWFLNRLTTLLQLAGIPTAGYSGQSFRAGAATAARQAGIPEQDIQTMGRWASTAYKAYVKLPPNTLLAVATSISQPRKGI
jgi:hypothetical protein